MTITNQTTQTPDYSTVSEFKGVYTESFGCGVANAQNMTLKGVIANFGAVETYDCGSAHRTNIMSKFGQKVTDVEPRTPSQNSGYSM